MRVLYLSGFHPVLEYDECLILEELGFDWFSTGIYHYPQKPLDIPSLNIRKPIDREPDPEVDAHFFYANPKYFESFTGLSRPHVVVPKFVAEWADVIFCTSYKFIINNWKVLKNKPIIWRTSGAINENMEQEMQPYVKHGNVYPVRFSNQELISQYSNGGEVIRNFADETIYKNWKVGGKNVLSFQSWFSERQSLPMNKYYISQISPNFACDLYGAFITKNPLNKGTLSWEKQIEVYKTCGVYFYIGSPVSIVAYNFLEAMMTGCPIVTYGPRIGGYCLQSTNEVLHEPSEFIENEVDGFYSDNTEQLKRYIKILLENPTMAEQVSCNARKKALKLFSKDKAIKKWKNFFKNEIK